MPVSPDMIFLIIILVVILLPIVWAIATYNILVRLRLQCREAWSGIDTELKRRYDLIPNLVETARGYMQHERGTFETVTNARSQAMSAKTVADAAKAEGALTEALTNSCLSWRIIRT
jgi:LemA protein